MDNTEQAIARGYEQDLWEFEARLRTSHRFEQTFQFYAVGGALIAILALVALLVRDYSTPLDIAERTLLLTGGTGFVMSIASVAFLFLRHQHSTFEADRIRYISAASEFLMQWTRFENVAGKRLASDQRNFNPLSVRTIISALLESDTLNAGDGAALEAALRFRNALLHKGSGVDYDHLIKIAKSVHEIVRRIESLDTSRP